MQSNSAKNCRMLSVISLKKILNLNIVLLRQKRDHHPRLLWLTPRDRTLQLQSLLPQQCQGMVLGQEESGVGQRNEVPLLSMPFIVSRVVLSNAETKTVTFLLKLQKGTKREVRELEVEINGKRRPIMMMKNRRMSLLFTMRITWNLCFVKWSRSLQTGM